MFGKRRQACWCWTLGQIKVERVQNPLLLVDAFNVNRDASAPEWSSWKGWQETLKRICRRVVPVSYTRKGFVLFLMPEKHSSMWEKGVTAPEVIIIYILLSWIYLMRILSEISPLIPSWCTQYAIALTISTTRLFSLFVCFVFISPVFQALQCPKCCSTT